MQNMLDKKIFVVDDDPFWTAMLSQILKNIGFKNMELFDNGNACINNLHLNPTLVFLDYQMEDINGIQVLQKIKEYDQNIGVVFCTAHQDLSVAVDAIKYGSFDYLLKENASKKEVTAIIDRISKTLLSKDR